MKAFTAFAPASIGNVSLGFDVLGAALAPVDGTKLGDEVEIKAAESFSLETVGRFAHKLPGDADSNIVTKCYLYKNNLQSFDYERTCFQNKNHLKYILESDTIK